MTTSRYERVTNNSTTMTAKVIGSSRLKAATPDARHELEEDLLGAVRRRRDAVGGEHAERHRLAEPLARRAAR